MNSSTPLPSQFDSPDGDQYAPPAPRRVGLVIATVVALGSLFWGAFWGPREVARWYLAAARNAQADMRYEAVVEAANKGLAWDDEYRDLVEARAIARLQLDDLHGSLQDFDRLIELASKDEKTTEAYMRAMAARTQVLQRLDRYQAAVDDWTDIVEFRREQYRLRGDSESQQAYALALNNRAYTQALGKIDIKGALKDIDLSIEIRGREDDPMLIDTLGYLLLLDGQNDEAVFYLESTVALATLQNGELRKRIEERMQLEMDQRRFEARLKLMDEQFSVMLHHRGEAYQATGETEQAEADFAEAEKLGYNPAKGIW